MPPQPSQSNGPHDPLSLRAVLVIVVAGAALGIGFNAMQRDADPAHALAWVKGERTVPKLELESHTPPAPMPSAAAAPVPETLAVAAPHAAATPPVKSVPPAAKPPRTAPAPVPAAHAAPAGAASFVERAPRRDPSAPSGAPVATDTRPGLSPPLRSPAAGDPAAAEAAAANLPVIPESREPTDGSLDVVRRLQAAGAAVILDARSPEEYAAGHIAGALSLPFEDVFKHPERVRAVETKGRPVITYCDGGDCDLSRSLAFSLIDAGQRRVVVFDGGLPAWRSAGLAVHTGAQP